MNRTYGVIKMGEIRQLVPCPCDSLIIVELGMPSSAASWSQLLRYYEFVFHGRGCC